MAYSYALSILCEPIRTLAFGGISGTFAGVGTSITNPARLVTLNNDTDANLYFSENGVDDHIFMPAKSGKVYDIAANQTHQAGGYKATGTRYYVRQVGAAPTTGAVYVEVQYGSNG